MSSSTLGNCLLPLEEDGPNSENLQDLDTKRHESIAYEYLCHLEETRSWIQSCIKEELPPTTELEESLRNGVYLAKLGNFINSALVPLRNIYDPTQQIYHAKGLQFRHTDNINYWIKAMTSVGFPSLFYPDVFDVYEKKNSPKVIYCLHGLSVYLYKHGLAPKMQDLYGRVEFSREDIGAMSKELEKYGLSLPSFHKINGILMGNIPDEDAILHAAVIAINAAIDRQLANETFSALCNPNAHLVNLSEAFTSAYQDMLFSAKQVKSQLVHERSLSLSTEVDVYDELLSHHEIQEVIDSVNISPYLTAIREAIQENSTSKVIDVLCLPDLQLHSIIAENGKLYIKFIQAAFDYLKINNNDAVPTRDLVQSAILDANDAATSYALDSLYAALMSGTPSDTYMVLQNPALGLPSIYEFAASLYHEEFKSSINENVDNLDQLKSGVEFLSSIAIINKAIMDGDVEVFYAALSSPIARISGVDSLNKSTYLKGLSKELENKRHGCKEPFPLLNHTEIQEIVDTVNSVMEDVRLKQEAIRKIYKAICAKNSTDLISSLLDPIGSILCVEPKYGKLYLHLFEQEIQELDSNETDLTLDDIQQVVNKGNKIAFKAYEKCIHLVAVNMAVRESDCNSLLSALKELGTRELTIDSCLGEFYLRSMRKLLKSKLTSLQLSEDGSDCWVYFRISRKLCFYYNSKTFEQIWSEPESFPHQVCLSLTEISTKVKQVNEKMLSLRKSSRSLKEWQSETATSAIITLQSHVRRWIAQKRYKEMQEQHGAAKKIQSWWQAHRMQACFDVLQHTTSDPPFHSVRQLVIKFQLTDSDYAEELDLRKMKAQIVQTIRRNQELEQEVKEMDIKIGLLVRNRITLQELISQKHSSKGKNTPIRSSESWIRAGRGLKALSKDSQKLLETYEQLFYILQTEPVYLARLIFAMPPSHSNKFLETVIFSLYNYGSSNWEAYQLQRLFRAALEQEINEKVTDVHGVSTGNPLVIKMVIAFNRKCNPGALREILETAVLQVLEDKNLKTVIHPVDAYLLMVSEMETHTGEVSGLPYDVTKEEALKHQEVRNHIDASIQNLQRQVALFCDRIVASVNEIPYGMLYITKVLKNALARKFPETPEKELLKVVGNLLYYRYLNPVITAPDVFDIISLKSEDKLTSEQRKNLGWIAKILQFAASGKGFGYENIHLESLNPFINKCFEKFQCFFQEACSVPEPEDYYNIDKYTEATFFVQPTVYLTFQELCDTHKLLLVHRRDVILNPDEPINRLLDSLGDPPTIEKLVGDDVDASSLNQLASNPVCLTLHGKLNIENVPCNDVEELFLLTKEMVVELLKVRSNSYITSIMDLLNIPVSLEEQTCFKNLQSSFRRQKSPDRNLASFIDELHQHLIGLELAGRVSKKNGYSEILCSIVKDIQHLTKHRQIRIRELKRLQNIQHQLNLKAIFFEEKLEYYQQYIRRCLDNLSANPSKARSNLKSKGDDKKLKMTTLKYTASKLHEKGVLVQVDGIETSKFKHITFEIAPTAENGVFTVSAKFFGMDVEKVFINIQDLLQLQYEGTAIMKLFDRATVNINLLLYVLNSKFYK